MTVIALTALAWSGSPRHVQAQTPPPPSDAPTWTIQVDPLTTALGFVHVQVEWALSRHVSAYVGPSLKLFRGPQEDADADYIGLGVELGVRWFWSGTAPEGWWAQARGVAARVSTDTPQDAQAFGGYVSALVGYTWIFDGWFVLSAGLGGQYIHYKVASQGLQGFLPAAHTTVGVAF